MSFWTSSNKALAVFMLALGSYLAWGRFHSKLFPLEPLQGKPYVVVYGRDDCGYTQAMRQGLSRQGVPFTYRIIDEDAVQEELYPRMKYVGLSTDYFDLPVVDVNSELRIRPPVEEVVAQYRPTTAGGPQH